MKTHLKTIAALIVIFSILTCLCYAIYYNPLIGIIIVLSMGFVVIYAIVYNVIKDNE